MNEPFQTSGTNADLPPRGQLSGSSGLTLIELMVGMVAGAILLSAAYSLMHIHSRQSYQTERKIELRGQMTLTAKRIQRAITMAGIGLNGSATLLKNDAVGSDTLVIFMNEAEANSPLISDANTSTPILIVQEPSLFLNAIYVAVFSDGIGEIRMITGQSGSVLHLDSPFSSPHATASSVAYPASLERYYSDQDSSHMVLEEDGEPRVVGRNLRNFQVSFKDRRGESTETASEIRTVQFSFAGIFPSEAGALNSVSFSSTAIPRNSL
ncbi:MAG: prepilin-type N-terminal cleavage/methylation domain-containing protein [Fibrobacterota bacterium]|nr:prepilin-type N-terminal cleavage/methylation domain-containing protein [Fibrobacterota bacterium]